MPKTVPLFIKKFGIYVVVALSLLANGYFLLSKNQEMVVSQIHDGDTFTLKNGERIRLLGVNAPELTNCGSTESAKILKDLILNKKIKITDEKRDTYGRRMGLVWLDNKLINKQMIELGFAKPNYDPNPHSNELKEAYKYASDNKIGINSSLCKKINPTPPSPNCTIKGNIDKGTGNKFYHLSTCPHYKQIVLDLDIGEKFFCSESEAKQEGFNLSSDCTR